MVLLISPLIASASNDDPQLKTINTKVNLIPLALESISAEIDVGITQYLAIGPMVSATKQFGSGDTHFRAYSLGVRGTYFFGRERFKSSWIGSVFAERLFLNLTYDGLKPLILNGSSGGFHWGALIGYQWHWDFGLNFTLGIGVASYDIDEKVTLTTQYLGQEIKSVQDIPEVDKIGSLFPALDIMIGWAL